MTNEELRERGKKVKSLSGGPLKRTLLCEVESSGRSHLCHNKGVTPWPRWATSRTT